MYSNDTIPAEEFCSHYKAELSFITSLQQVGLIEIISVEKDYYIPHSQLPKLEQLVTLHYDLDINLEGIDAISHLLDRVKSLQFEVTALKNRLKLYEKT